MLFGCPLCQVVWLCDPWSLHQGTALWPPGDFRVSQTRGPLDLSVWLSNVGISETVPVARHVEQEAGRDTSNPRLSGKEPTKQQPSTCKPTYLKTVYVLRVCFSKSNGAWRLHYIAFSVWWQTAREHEPVSAWRTAEVHGLRGLFNFTYTVYWLLKSDNASSSFSRNFGDHFLGTWYCYGHRYY